MTTTTIKTTRLAVLPVAAASGLVAVGPRLYVVADDEIDLAVLDRACGLLARLPLFPGDPPLPDGLEARKLVKPDLEALTRLPVGGSSGAVLLALGSGSRPTRHRGALLALDDGGALAGPVLAVDLAPLHQSLAQDFGGQLNLEGAAACDGALWLFQRGGRGSGNALVEISLPGFLHALIAGDPPPPELVIAIHRVDLGAIDGVPLGFTDASPLPDGRIVFAAAAEQSQGSYDDGPCAGSVVGLIDQGKLVRMQRLDTPLKIEGVHAEADGQGAIQLLLVSDADDPTVRSPLLSASIDS